MLKNRCKRVVYNDPNCIDPSCRGVLVHDILCLISTIWMVEGLMSFMAVGGYGIWKDVICKNSFF